MEVTVSFHLFIEVLRFLLVSIVQLPLVRKHHSRYFAPQHPISIKMDYGVIV